MRTMMLVAVDVAILPPPDVMATAIEYNAALSAHSEPGSLRLDDEHLPHITLTQHFIRADELDRAFLHVNAVLADQPPVRVAITGGGRSNRTLWMSVERTLELVELHERLMKALGKVERPRGGPHAFFEEGRVRDVMWVARFRLKASGSRFAPHITIGHGAEVPVIEPMSFDATTIAACHLGRFCTCCKVLRAWDLRGLQPDLAIGNGLPRS